MPSYFHKVSNSCKYAQISLKNLYICANTLPFVLHVPISPNVGQLYLMCRYSENCFKMMKMRRSLFCICALSLLFMTFSCTAPAGYVTISGYAQGGTYTVKANLKGVDVSPQELRDSIDAILQAVDKSVSGYNKGSILSRLNRGEAVVPDRILLDLYRRSSEIYVKTGGCVDVAGAALFDIWGFGFKTGQMPSDQKVAETLASSGMDRLVSDMEVVLGDGNFLSPESLLLPAEKDNGTFPVLPQLNFNAVAQGYSCDIVAAYLSRVGVKDMMVDIGEIFCQGVNPDGHPWKLGIDRPLDGNNTPGADLQGVFAAPSRPCGIVTSGNYRKFYIHNGKKYAHTIDPRTGYPVRHHLLSATVVAPDGFTADAYATYCMVVGPDQAKAFITAEPSLEACLVMADGDSTAIWCSDGFVLESI